MNSIEYMGRRLKIKRYSGTLYRADRNTFLPGSLASQNYKNAPMKYFTLHKNETSAYTKYGMLHVKTWVPTQELILVDILHTPTRRVLEELIGEESLRIAFPLRGERTSRISEENTKQHNDNVLRSICDLGIFDGYYMEKLSGTNGTDRFHSEVGLCPRAFHKLRLESVNKNKYQPPPPPTRKRRRNNNNNTYTSKRSRFNMMNNNNNTGMPFFGRR